MAEGSFPKTDGEVLFASEVNNFYDDTQYATTSNKGISSFNSTHFTVSSGAVSIIETSINPTSLASGCVAVDHGTGTTDQVINACYGTSSTPPSIGTVTEGTVYFQYV